DGERACRRAQLGEVGGQAVGRDAGDELVEGGEAVDVVGDEADRCEGGAGHGRELPSVRPRTLRGSPPSLARPRDTPVSVFTAGSACAGRPRAPGSPRAAPRAGARARSWPSPGRRGRAGTP